MLESESVQVMVRCRPLNEQEKAGKQQGIVAMETSSGQVTVQDPESRGSEGERRYTFDAVFDEHCSQSQIFRTAALPIVDSALSGFNGTIFAYGQTGTGKTHTMDGGDGEQQGIIPRSFEHLFNSIRETGQTKYLVQVSFLEIYQERIRDLLAPGDPKNEGSGLAISDTPEGGVKVKELRTEVVESVPAMLKLLEEGKKHRAVGAQKMNQHSSRSHSVFTITIECAGEATQQHVRRGCLHLVDLAGSERQKKTEATGERLNEAKRINLSLSALGNVIKALVDGKGGHIPYRDSKLTHLLRDSLGGNTKTVMIANVGPASSNRDETVNTLRYANDAKRIKNKPTINEDPKDAMLRVYQEEMERLKVELAEGCGAEACAPDAAITEEDMERMRAELAEQLCLNATATGTHLSETLLAEIEEEARQKAEEKKAELQAKAKAAADEVERIQLQAAAQAGSLEKKQAEAERLKGEKQKMAERLQFIESKILQSETEGGECLMDQAKSREARIQEHQQELERRRVKEVELEAQLAQQEEVALMKEQQYASLDQEVKGTKSKLMRLQKKLQDVSQEVEQKYADWQTDKANFLEDYSILQSQMRLKQLEIDLFIPIEEVNKVMHNAKWNDERELWIMDTSVNAKRNVKSAKRPVSASGLRRPTTDFTKTANAMGDLNPRFRPENILSLELDLPERTTFDYESLEERGDIQAALNMAYPQDMDVIFAGDGSMQGLYTEEGHSTATKAAAPWPHSDARTPSGRQRPASARRKS